jgi:hypothetical protein
MPRVISQAEYSKAPNQIPQEHLEADAAYLKFEPSEAKKL